MSVQEGPAQIKSTTGILRLDRSGRVSQRFASYYRWPTTSKGACDATLFRSTSCESMCLKISRSSGVASKDPLLRTVGEGFGLIEHHLTLRRQIQKLDPLVLLVADPQNEALLSMHSSTPPGVERSKPMSADSLVAPMSALYRGSNVN